MAVIQRQDVKFVWEDERTLLHVPTDTHFRLIGEYGVYKYEAGWLEDSKFWPNDVIGMAEKLIAEKLHPLN